MQSVKLPRPRAPFATIFITLSLLLSACGGGNSAPSTGGFTPTPSPTPTPTPSSTCSLRSRQDWAAAQLREFYLFPETLPATLDPALYTSVTTYIDALTATARARGYKPGWVGMRFKEQFGFWPKGI